MQNERIKQRHAPYEICRIGHENSLLEETLEVESDARFAQFDMMLAFIVSTSLLDILSNITRERYIL